MITIFIVASHGISTLTKHIHRRKLSETPHGHLEHIIFLDYTPTPKDMKAAGMVFFNLLFSSSQRSGLKANGSVQQTGSM